MFVIEIFLPLERNDGSPQPRDLFERVSKSLMDDFGGVTAYSRAPAEGRWKNDDGAAERDSIVIFEVVAETLDRRQWAEWRKKLEAMFDQEEVLIRSTAVERL
jgi:hypothetical protein